MKLKIRKLHNKWWIIGPNILDNVSTWEDAMKYALWLLEWRENATKF